MRFTTPKPITNIKDIVRLPEFSYNVYLAIILIVLAIIILYFRVLEKIIKKKRENR